MADKPIVSVILPSYNRLNYLRVAVESVLAQTFGCWELIVADDGSQDETRLFLQRRADPRIVIILLAHTGNPSAVRNAAIRRARGDYLAFLDSDDVWLPGKLDTQLRLMRSRPERRWSYTRELLIDENGGPASTKRVRPWLPYEGDIVAELLRIDALVSTTTVIAERSLVLQAGAFDEQQRFCEDYDLWLRLALRSEVSALAAPLACVRVHNCNYSRDRIGVHEGWAQLYTKMSLEVGSHRLRRVCLRKRAESAVLLAALHGRQGRYRTAARILSTAVVDGWRNPQAFLPLAKSAAKMTGRAIFGRLEL